MIQHTLGTANYCLSWLGEQDSTNFILISVLAALLRPQHSKNSALDLEQV